MNENKNVAHYAYFSLVPISRSLVPRSIGETAFCPIMDMALCDSGSIRRAESSASKVYYPEELSGFDLDGTQMPNVLPIAPDFQLLSKLGHRKRKCGILLQSRTNLCILGHMKALRCCLYYR